MAKTTYLSIPLLELSADKEFPGPIYLCISHRMVRYRNKGDKFDTEGLNKLIYNKVQIVFIEEADKAAFDAWTKGNDATDQKQIQEAPPEAQQIVEAVQDQRRAAMDMFLTARSEPQVKYAVESSRKLVGEFLKKPFAVNNIAALARYSKGTVDHSVNVSTLAVFLGIRMGYTHQLILENLALGGLFHDIGKTLVPKSGDALLSDDDPAMQEHPKLGRELLEKSKDRVPNEVLMIVGQHHEFLDGSGYPNGLKGLAVYDLARLVSIANIYDNLVSESKQESIKDRCSEALDRLEADYENKLDPRKMEKIVKILKYSLT